MGTNAKPALLADLLFGSTRRKVLALLLGRPDERFYLREITRAVGGGVGAVQRELKQLVAAGLLEREARGHQVYFWANRHAAIFPDLQAIMEKTADAVDLPRTRVPFLNRVLARPKFAVVGDDRELARPAGARVASRGIAFRDEVTRLRGPILDAAAANGARDVRLFGSVARGEERADSDVDFLVSLEPGRTLLDLARLEARLEELLHRPADVVTPESLRESIRVTAVREAVPV
jgi:predicted nucleotidyltransferase